MSLFGKKKNMLIRDEITVGKIAGRFMRYASIATQSEDGHEETPSTPGQFDLARLLTQELTAMGAADVYLDETHCYVYATIPGNLPVTSHVQKLLDERTDTERKRRENAAPIIGLVAHMDTSDAVPSDSFHPRKIEKYDGGRIVLDADRNIFLDPAEFQDLSDHKGQTLVVTDGHSVLGGDDKSGVAEIMETARFFLAYPEYPHGTIRIMFTPDEEVGNGVKFADLDRFAVDYAYTIDGGAAGELQYESFNAASLQLHFHGHSTHPGSARGKMRNALLMAMEYNALLPEKETPFYTDGHEGFFHLEKLNGTVDEAAADYIIRDHDMRHFIARKETAIRAAEEIRSRYGKETVSCLIQDSYYNMASRIRPHMHLIDNAKAAMKEVGVKPLIAPIRGGTDGCMLSFEGIPCPNLGTGSYHYHSRYEYVSADEMAKCAEIIVRILYRYAAYELDPS